MTASYALYDDFFGCLEEMQRLEQVGIYEFCESLSDEKRKAYFPLEDARAVIEDEKRAKTYYLVVFSFLKAMGLTLSNDWDASFVVTEPFWRTVYHDASGAAPATNPVCQVFIDLYSSMAAMGLWNHFTEIYNLVSLEMRAHRVTKQCSPMPSAMKHLKEGTAARRCRLVIDSMSGEQIVEWEDISPFAGLLPISDEEAAACSSKLTGGDYDLKGRKVWAGLCKHQFLMVPVPNGTKMRCGFPPPGNCDAEQEI
jgi:hypothetical protein